MSAGFGFSFGDIVTGIQLISKIVTAMKDTGGASEDYQLVNSQYHRLLEALRELQNPSLRNSTDDSYDLVSHQAFACEKTLEALRVRISKFDSALGLSARKGMHHGIVRKAQWALSSPETSKLWKTFRDQLLGLQLAIAATDLNRSSDDIIQAAYDWLSPLARVFESRQIDTFNIEGRQDGLGNWLVKTVKFKNWMSGTAENLCCCGQPGVGKTILASFVINYLEQIHENSDIGIAYIYCSYKEASKQTPANLIASLAHQLLRQKPILRRELLALHKEHTQKKTRPTLGECATLLQSAIDLFSKVYIVIDALDELPEASQVRQGFLERIGELDHVNVFVTSRNIPIESELYNTTRLDVWAHDVDIREYLKERISRSTRLKRLIAKDSTLHNAIKETILAKAKGMFLLAFLHLESLKTKNDVRSLKEALNSMPEGLSATYDEAMERIRSQSSDDCELAIKVLSWVHHALRPLTLQEIQHGLAVRPGDHNMDEEGISEEERLLSVCAGLITLERESRKISLVHFSAQEYFKRKAAEHFPQAQDDIATICLTYLSFEKFEAGPCISDEELEKRLQEYPLLAYAAVFWVDHFRQGSRRDMDLVLGFFKEESKIACCIQIIHENSIIQPPGERHLRRKRLKESQHSLRDVHSLWLAAYLGMSDIIKDMLEKGTDVQMKTGYGETALHPAARCGSASAVKELLAAGADINTSNESGDTPLLIATWHMETEKSHLSDHEAVFQILIDGGAEVTATDLDGSTALHWAAENGHEAGVNVLLNQGANINAQDNIYRSTALHLAAEFGHEVVVKLLLDRKGNLEAKRKSGSTALHLATMREHEAVVKLLLEGGADIEAKTSGNSWTALHLAARDGYEALLKLLLENKANIEMKDKTGATPLHIAAEKGQETAVKLLLENGGNIEASDDINGTTVLTVAAQYGHYGMVKLLLERGAKINVREKEDWTALHAAAQHGHKAVVKLLLEKGADPLLTSSAGRTALHMAAEIGCEAIVKMLHENGADIAAIDNDSWTTLRLAAFAGHEAVVKLALDNGVDTEARGNANSTALHLATKAGYEAVVKLLLDRGANIEAKMPKGVTALHLAALCGHESVANLLVEKGANIEARDHESCTALHLAALSGHESVVNLLVDKGANIEARDHEGCTALHLAAQNGHELAVNLLINKQANIAARDKFHWTALHLAAQNGRTAVVKQLLEKRTDVQAKEEKGWTALHLAAENGHEEVVKLLLEKGANVLVESNSGITALTLASKNQHEAVVKLLLDNGAHYS